MRRRQIEPPSLAHPRSIRRQCRTRALPSLPWLLPSSDGVRRRGAKSPKLAGRGTSCHRPPTRSLRAWEAVGELNPLRWTRRCLFLAARDGALRSHREVRHHLLALVLGQILDQQGTEAICSGGPAFDELVEPSSLTINMLFAAGNRAAFHVACHGGYAGGFSDIDPTLTGQPVTLPMAGMLTLDEVGEVSRVQISADRLGLHRKLLDATRN